MYPRRGRDGASLTIKPTMTNAYDAQVEGFLSSLEVNYASILRHDYVRRPEARGEEVPREEFLALLTRTTPVTELEKIVQATLRWQARRARPAFTTAIAEGGYHCIALLIDGPMTDWVLEGEGSFHVTRGAGGFGVELDAPASSRPPTPAEPAALPAAPGKGGRPGPVGSWAQTWNDPAPKGGGRQDAGAKGGWDAGAKGGWDAGPKGGHWGGWNEAGHKGGGRDGRRGEKARDGRDGGRRPRAPPGSAPRDQPVLNDIRRKALLVQITTEPADEFPLQSSERPGARDPPAAAPASAAPADAEGDSESLGSGGSSSPEGPADEGAAAGGSPAPSNYREVLMATPKGGNRPAARALNGSAACAACSAPAAKPAAAKKPGASEGPPPKKGGPRLPARPPAAEAAAAPPAPTAQAAPQLDPPTQCGSPGRCEPATEPAPAAAPPPEAGEAQAAPQEGGTPLGATPGGRSRRWHEMGSSDEDDDEGHRLAAAVVRAPPPAPKKKK